MKRRLRNLSKGKLAAALVIMCALVFGGYFGYHKFVVHADSKPNKAVVNTLAEYNAMCESGKVDPSQEAGDKDNPFLILEIVPYYGQAEFGYLIGGCEPIDFSDVSNSIYSAASNGVNTVATAVFKDEFDRDKALYDEGKYIAETKWTQQEGWNLYTNDEVETHGYYERVSDGQTGDFVIDRWDPDRSGAYHPVFRKAKDGENGQFTWTTLYCKQSGDFVMSTDKFNDCASKENKSAETAEGEAYKPGEREYTTRKDTNYYGFAQQGEMQWGHYGELGYIKGHAFNCNEFIRTSLDLDDKSEQSIRNLKIAIKTIEPQELKNHPEWIDYADLIYINQHSSSIYPQWWANTSYDKLRRLKDELGESYYSGKEDTIRSSFNSIDFSSDNDWGWNVAKKLFFKINQLEQYDGDHEYGFAPLLFSVSALDRLNTISQSVYGSKWKTVNHYHLDYTTMESDADNPKHTYEGGTNSGIFKFMLMNFLMDGDNFYNYFFKTERDSGGTVITEDASKDVSYCTPQKGADAQEYWSVHAFLPITEAKDDSNITQDQIDRYSILHYGNAYLNLPRPSLHGATFIYNSDNLLSQKFDKTKEIPDNSLNKEAFDWFEEEYGDRPESLTPAQMIHYLLQYKRHGNDDDDVGTRDKETMHVLEIEPCADYIMSEKYLTGKYLPASRFKGQIEVDHMTTAEFNSLRRDINGYYDLIYIGDNIGKFNTEEKNAKTSTTHNDSKLDGYVYIHVGDKADDAGKLRFSGDDISKLKIKQLQEYAQGGNALVLADTLAISPNQTDMYNNTYSKAVDLTSNMHALFNSLKSSNKGTIGFKKTNVCALSKLSVKFLSEKCLKYMKKGYDLPKKTQTGLTTKAYKQLTKDYKKYVGMYSEITSTPARWYDADGVKDEEELNTATKTKDSVQNLEFRFRIGDPNGRYAGRLYIDLNGDGVIADDELVKDTYGDNMGYTWSYQGEEAKDASGNVYKDKSGAAITVPGEQTYNYDQLSSNKSFYLNKTKKSGAVTWKFVLYNVSTQENYQSVTGTSRYARDGEGVDNVSDKNKTELKIYQILDDDKVSSDANLENQLANGGLFLDYTKDLSDFTVTAKSIGLKDFEAELTAGNIGTTTSGEDYNCYVVSCGSTIFKDALYKKAADFLTDKAKNGVSVVFTGEALDAKTTSEDAKNVLNMSRFTADKTYGDIRDKATSPAGDYEDTSKMEYTYSKVMSLGSTGKKKAYNDDFWKKNYGTNSGKATEVCRNNKGRYTTYPYNINKTFAVDEAAGVTAQDYQLNMDNDALTVWYSLGPDGEGDDTEYGISPRDGANNYYLYSVSNVVYDLINLESVSDPMEMKLFINVLSGNAVSPLVTVDSGQTVDSGYGEVKIAEVTNETNYFPADDIKRSETGADMTVYWGQVASSGSDYEDYRDNRKKVKGDGTGTGGKIDDTDPTPIPATPTPKPVKQPQKLFSGTTDKFEAGRGQDKNLFKGWDDDAVLVAEFKKDGNTDGYKATKDQKLFAFYTVGKDAEGQDKELTESGGISPYITYQESDSDKYMISIGSLKKLYGVGSDPITSLAIKAKDQGVFKITMVGVFASENQYRDYKKGKVKFATTNNTGGEDLGEDTGESIVESDETKVGHHDEAPDAATKRSWIPDSATHRIFFTPYTNATDSKNVYSFKISRITASVNDLGTSKEKTVGDYVNTIFRKVNTAAGNYVWKFTANKDTHMFTISDDNFLSDKTQYYFYSEGTDINTTLETTGDSTKWIRFDISNRRKSAITYLHLFYDRQVDTTYLFNLD